MPAILLLCTMGEGALSYEDPTPLTDAIPAGISAESGGATDPRSCTQLVKQMKLDGGSCASQKALLSDYSLSCGSISRTSPEREALPRMLLMSEAFDRESQLMLRLSTQDSEDEKVWRAFIAKWNTRIEQTPHPQFRGLMAARMANLRRSRDAWAAKEPAVRKDLGGSDPAILSLLVTSTLIKELESREAQVSAKQLANGNEKHGDAIRNAELNALYFHFPELKSEEFSKLLGYFPIKLRSAPRKDLVSTDLFVAGLDNPLRAIAARSAMIRADVVEFTQREPKTAKYLKDALLYETAQIQKKLDKLLARASSDTAITYANSRLLEKSMELSKAWNKGEDAAFYYSRACQARTQETESQAFKDSVKRYTGVVVLASVVISLASRKGSNMASARDLDKLADTLSKVSTGSGLSGLAIGVPTSLYEIFDSKSEYSEAMTLYYLDLIQNSTAERKRKRVEDAEHSAKLMALGMGAGVAAAHFRNAAEAAAVTGTDAAFATAKLKQLTFSALDWTVEGVYALENIMSGNWLGVGLQIGARSIGSRVPPKASQSKAPTGGDSS